MFYCSFLFILIPSEFQKDLSITFRVILLIHRQTNRQTKASKIITSLPEVKSDDVAAAAAADDDDGDDTSAQMV